jgi:hypothetical protein
MNSQQNVKFRIAAQSSYSSGRILWQKSGSRDDQQGANSDLSSCRKMLIAMQSFV